MIFFQALSSFIAQTRPAPLLEPAKIPCSHLYKKGRLTPPLGTGFSQAAFKKSDY
jgi:hypothetical protein